MAISILWGCALITVVVFGVMVHSIASFRAQSDGSRANFRPCALIEVTWTLVPIAIFIGAALPAARMIVTIDNPVADAAEQGTFLQECTDSPPSDFHASINRSLSASLRDLTASRMPPRRIPASYSPTCSEGIPQ